MWSNVLESSSERVGLQEAMQAPRPAWTLGEARGTLRAPLEASHEC